MNGVVKYDSYGRALPKVSKLTLVRHYDGEWEALYADGKKVWEHENLDASTLFSTVDLEVDFEEVYGYLAEDILYYPPKLEDVELVNPNTGRLLNEPRVRLVLSGSKQEFDDWMLEQTDPRDIFYLPDALTERQPIPASGLEIVGTFWDRKDAMQVIDYAYHCIKLGK